MANEFSPMVDYNFKVEEGFTREKINEFCDGRNDSKRLPKLLCEFVKLDQTSGSQQAVDRLNLFKSTLYACKDVNPVGNFQTMMLEWNTGASFGLTEFKDNFVDYVECDIPVKDVNKVKSS